MFRSRGGRDGGMGGGGGLPYHRRGGAADAYGGPQVPAPTHRAAAARGDSVPVSPWMVMSLLCSATMVTLFAGHALLDSPIARFPYMSDAQLMEAHEEQTAEFARLLLQQEADTRKAVAATRGSPGCSVAELINPTTVSDDGLVVGVLAHTLCVQSNVPSSESEEVTQRLIAVLARTPGVRKVLRYGPGRWSTMTTDKLDVLLVDGYAPQLVDQVYRMREASVWTSVLVWLRDVHPLPNAFLLPAHGFIAPAAGLDLVLARSGAASAYLPPSTLLPATFSCQGTPRIHAVTFVGDYDDSRAYSMLSYAAPHGLKIFGRHWEGTPWEAFVAGPTPPGGFGAVACASSTMFYLPSRLHKASGVLPNDLMDALAAGAVVLTEPVDRLKELLPAAAALVPVWTPDDVARLVQDVMYEPHWKEARAASVAAMASDRPFNVWWAGVLRLVDTVSK